MPMVYSIWEDVDDHTDRLRVPGGWLVRSVMRGMSAVSLTTIFVSDPTYDWAIPKRPGKPDSL